MYKMHAHDGCVNALHFNSTGTRLASGSDDLSVVIWDWATGEPVLKYDSGHRSNVFQVREEAVLDVVNSPLPLPPVGV